MSYIIKHPRYGYYTGHVNVPRFTYHRHTKKSPYAKWQEFNSRQEALDALKKVGMEGCTIEPDSK